MISSHVDFDTALGQLRRLLAIGGPETGDWSSPVQILDSADAPGLEFDAAFLTGINDETWPSAEIPTSLIPARLQRAAGVPEADPRNVRTLGINATRALVHAAPLIAGAYHDRLAPQVRACARVARLSSGVWTGKTPLESFSPTQMEEFRETSGPAFDTTREARGGTRVIKAQSECPFKAFAETRLRAVLPEDASFGFDALDRGKFVHVALEYVWRELKTQAALLATSPDDLLGLVRRSVDHALANQDTTEFYLQTSAVERERLERLIYDWLTTVERQRTVPFTVESAEQEIHITIGGLPLRVRLDRIDRLPNGAVVLIDYKTGAGINKNRLAGDRPAEPQLLIYAAAQAGPVDGLLFGCVVPRDLRYAGFTRGKLLSSTTVTPHKQWDEFLEESRENVEKLAAEYVRGEAVINPSRHNCQYCDLAMLCRKDEQQALAEDGE
jgi:probable DNA repair protein